MCELTAQTTMNSFLFLLYFSSMQPIKRLVSGRNWLGSVILAGITLLPNGEGLSYILQRVMAKSTFKYKRSELLPYLTL